MIKNMTILMHRHILTSKMIALILLVHTVGSVIASTSPRAHHLNDSYTFSQYLLDFSKSYPPNEYSRRLQIFQKNLAKILSHNDDITMDNNGRSKGGYVMGVNRFTDMEEHEIGKGFRRDMHPAWLEQLLMKREDHAHGAVATERTLGEASSKYSHPPNFEVEPISSLPSSIDWSHKVNAAPNQGMCGSCWAVASTSCIESHLAIATKSNLIELSDVNILDCTPNPQYCGGTGGCDGATVELAWDYIADLTANKNGGMYLASDLNAYSGDEACSFDASPLVGIQGWTLLPSNNYTMVMNALAKVGPLAIAVAASSWANYEYGVFRSSSSTVDHAVVLVGYGTDESSGEDYWLVRNSWGADWGENGYIRILRSEDESSNCKIDTDPLMGIGCQKDANGNDVDVQPVQVCGESAVLFDAAYPVGVHMI